MENDTCQGQFDWSGELTAVPGFGFLPPCVEREMEKRFQVLLSMVGIDKNNLTNSHLAHMKCEYVVKQFWRHFHPHLTNITEKTVCLPHWDNTSCFPPTLSGHVATIPCIGDAADGIATRNCFANGSWEPETDYSDCWTQDETALTIPLLIYAIGYILSFLALVVSLAVFLYFRELKCLRHKIHVSLFLSFALSSFNWIIINMFIGSFIVLT